MGDVIISAASGQLKSTVFEEAKERVKLVICVDNEVDSLRKNFEAIGAVMVDADRRQWKEERVRLWLEELKQASYDMEDVLDEWNTARLELKSEGDADENALMKKVCSFFLAAASCFGLEQVCSFFRADSCFGVTQISLRHEIARKIKKINKNLDAIAKRKDAFNFNVNATVEESKLVKSERVQTTAFMSEVCGREMEKDALKKLCESSAEQNGVQIISLVGMGGIGKTTLAQYAYNHQDVKKNFEKRMWVCVSDPFDEFKVAKAILGALKATPADSGQLNSLLECIEESIAGKSFFLVLDDVWTEDYQKWEPFRNCLMKGLRGTILVTTRKEDTAKIMGSTTDNIIPITGLSKHECWSLFERFAFFDRSHSEIEQLQEIGRNIVEKCKGLPLAVKTIGSLLRSKKTREGWQIISDSELWQVEGFEKGVLAPLLLSYYDLPSKIKRCFSYCAVFPKDYYIQKDELIQLWMAQGYIEPGNNEDLETMGETYFNCLATRSFFQEFRYNRDGTILACTMHDLVHDFAQFLVKDEFSFMQLIDGSQESLSSRSTFDPEKLRHSMLELEKGIPVPVSIINAKKLRSLLINDMWFQMDSFGVLQSLFNELTCLRALKVVGSYTLSNNDSQMTVNELVKGIGKLIHLRYLKLDGIIIEEFPEIWCKLFNLQTLDISDCSRLPQWIGKLVNLRHLILCDDLDYMPKGVERLTSLRTLREFVVVRSDGKYGREACKLDGLKELNHLRGYLSIRGLGNVTDVDEAKNAHLEKKKNLVSLTLWFDLGLIERDEEAIAGMDHEEIIEALRPPPNLESLELCWYKGKNLFPNWITSLNKLKQLQLDDFDNLENMPPLGKLPSLEELILSGIKRIKRVGDEFLGIESSDHVDGTSSSITAFPKLKTLKLAWLNEWEGWDFGNEDITVLPQLSYLEIDECEKLKSIPDQFLRSTLMKKLKISRCPILTKLLKKTGENRSKISHIPEIQINGRYVQIVPFQIPTDGQSLLGNDVENSNGYACALGWKQCLRLSAITGDIIANPEKESLDTKDKVQQANYFGSHYNGEEIMMYSRRFSLWNLADAMARAKRIRYCSPETCLILLSIGSRATM